MGRYTTAGFVNAEATQYAGKVNWGLTPNSVRTLNLRDCGGYSVNGTAIFFIELHENTEPFRAIVFETSNEAEKMLEKIQAIRKIALNDPQNTNKGSRTTVDGIITLGENDGRPLEDTVIKPIYAATIRGMELKGSTITLRVAQPGVKSITGDEEIVLFYETVEEANEASKEISHTRKHVINQIMKSGMSIEGCYSINGQEVPPHPIVINQSLELFSIREKTATLIGYATNEETIIDTEGNKLELRFTTTQAAKELTKYVNDTLLD